ncbi:PKD domain-containing protein [Chloroflexota bacterium]
MLIKRISVISLCILILVFSLQILSCGSSDGDNNDRSFSGEGETFDLINRVSESDSSEKLIEVINDVIQHGRSLGLLDENGEQLNPNVSDDAISLTPEDIASFSTFVEIGHYSTVGDVIDYLAEVGVVLSETGAVINPTDFLPDLQENVDWSFRNGDDPDSQLGILLGSGPEMVIPTNPPEMDTSTQISSMAAVMMLGDILIGTEDNVEKPSAGLFTKVARAADVQETAKRIKGLITAIESFAKPANLTVSMIHDAGKILGWTKKSDNPPPQIKIPDEAKKIIGAFALGSHFAVRLQAFKAGDSPSPKDIPVLKSFDLDQVGRPQMIIATLVLVSSDKNEPVVLVDDQMPIVYSLRLLSPFETGVGTDLYPDANAILVRIQSMQETAAGEHILDIVSGNSEFFEGSFKVEATKLENKEPRVALLHASASILTGDLGAQFEKYQKQYSRNISALGLKPEDLTEMFDVMQTAVKVSPWVAQVILIGGKQVTLEPDELVGKPNQVYTFTAKTDNQPAGSKWIWEAVLKQKGQNPKTIEPTHKENVALISFPEPGEYLVTVDLMDGDWSDARVISGASASVTIEPEATDSPEIELSIEVNKQPPYEGGCGLLFTARPSVENKELPENIRWEWYWGTGDKDVRKGQPHVNRLEHMISYAYNMHGNFTVLVKLFNDDNNTLLATADMPINIDNLGAIQCTKWARAMFWAYNLEEVHRLRDGEWTKTGDFNSYKWVGSNSKGYGLEWDGNNFSITFGGDGIQSSKFTIVGKVSEDVTRIETVTTTEEYTNPDTNQTLKKVLILSDVPITKYNCGDDVRYTCIIKGADHIKPLVTHYEYERKSPEQIDKHVGFDWNYQDQEPRLELEFNAME